MKISRLENQRSKFSLRQKELVWRFLLLQVIFEILDSSPLFPVEKIVPDFCLCLFLDFRCVVFLIYLILVNCSADNQGHFKPMCTRFACLFTFNILVIVIDIVIFHLSSFDLEDPMIFQWFLNGKVVWCSKENRQSVLLENWEILYSTILPLHPFSCL